MEQSTRKLLRSLILGMGLLQGCASLDARPEYDEVSRIVSDKTGHPMLTLPADEGQVPELVGALLEEGIMADEAVTLSLINSPRLRALLLEVGISRAEFAQASFLANPAVALSVRFPNGGGLPNLEGSIVESLSDLWRLPFRKGVAEASLRRTVVEVAREVGQRAREARVAYIRALAAEQVVTIAVENRAVTGRFLEVALARKSGGEGSGVDVAVARSEVSATEIAIRSASLDAFARRADLAAQLGLSTPPDELLLADSLPKAEPILPPLEDVLAALDETRLDLIASRRALDAAESALTYERLGILSVFQVGAAIERSERRSGEESSSSDYIVGPSVGFELPIFDQNRARIRRAALELEQARLLLKGSVIDATQETRAAYQKVMAHLEVAKLYETEHLPDRERVFKLVSLAYDGGELPVASMLEAQRGLLAARVEVVKARQAAALALTEFESAAGRAVR